ncbi:MAG TPA: hypothetical protein VN088_08455 [Nocardioides sp.]|nr:hypothetical protein [Nocardioides sp.]
MPKGGARINSGPAPDPNALRRDRQQDRDGWTTLPAEGRTDAAPVWPFAQAAERELEVWSAIWSTPQSVAWQRLGWLHDVALYVRHLVLAENGDLKAAGEARQWSDRLGLNPAAMLRNRWKVAADETKERREQRSGASDVRDRLKAISGGAG